MKYNFLLITFLAAFIACNGQTTTTKEPETAPVLYNTDDDDPEMNAAIKTAQSTLPQLQAALKNKKYDTGTPALKVAYPTESGAEHIWVSDIRLKNGQYSGTINNPPAEIPALKMGDKIKIENQKITDWMFVENGVLRGGYTIRLIRNRMTKEEREAFDTSFPYKLED